MRTVARLITTEVCPHCSPTSMLSSCQVFASSCHLRKSTFINASHNPWSIKPTQAGQARLLLPPRDSIISSSVVARLPGCQPAGSLVFFLKLVLCCLASQGCTWTCASSQPSRTSPKSSCGVLTRVLYCVLCMPRSPAQPKPSPLCFFASCIFLIMLHLPSFASWHLIRAHHPGIRTCMPR